MPRVAYTYALPREVIERYRIRRYGFHGISHRYVSLNEPGRVISCHLGNGASVAAIRDGKCVDTSMGLTPLEGLVMGTRTGDLDPGIVLFLLSKGFTPQELDEMFNERSGLLGLSGESNDLRELEASGSEGARPAIDVFVYRLVKYSAELDEEKNLRGEGIISTQRSSVCVKVKKTDEELMIAKEVYKLVGGYL